MRERHRWLPWPWQSSSPRWFRFRWRSRFRFRRSSWIPFRWRSRFLPPTSPRWPSSTWSSCQGRLLHRRRRKPSCSNSTHRDKSPPDKACPPRNSSWRRIERIRTRDCPPSSRNRWHPRQTTSRLLLLLLLLLRRDSESSEGPKWSTNPLLLLLPLLPKSRSDKTERRENTPTGSRTEKSQPDRASRPRRRGRPACRRGPRPPRRSPFRWDSKCWACRRRRRQCIGMKMVTKGAGP
mmetsp:Transcript_24628/g.50756  ORF Transcript_24628/g.50756 Transcript_24628/m.50756 type:complete len:236 (-) Transcript_24628:180-887(-)